MLKDFWGSMLLFQVGAFRQLMNEEFSVWDSKYLTGNFRKICASEFSRPFKKKKLKRKEKVFPAVTEQKAEKHKKEEGD